MSKKKQSKPNITGNIQLLEVKTPEMDTYIVNSNNLHLCLVPQYLYQELKKQNDSLTHQIDELKGSNNSLHQLYDQSVTQVLDLTKTCERLRQEKEDQEHHIEVLGQNDETLDKMLTEMKQSVGQLSTDVLLISDLKKSIDSRRMYTQLTKLTYAIMDINKELRLDKQLPRFSHVLKSLKRQYVPTEHYIWDEMDKNIKNIRLSVLLDVVDHLQPTVITSLNERFDGLLDQIVGIIRSTRYGAVDAGPLWNQAQQWFNTD